MVCVIHMSVSCKKSFPLNYKHTVIRQNRKLKHHLVHLCLAVSSYCINLIFFVIQHGNDFFWSILLWKVISRSVIKQISEKHKAFCPFFSICLLTIQNKNFVFRKNITFFYFLIGNIFCPFHMGNTVFLFSSHIYNKRICPVHIIVQHFR